MATSTNDKYDGLRHRKIPTLKLKEDQNIIEVRRIFKENQQKIIYIF